MSIFKLITGTRALPLILTLLFGLSGKQINARIISGGDDDSLTPLSGISVKSAQAKDSVSNDVNGIPKLPIYESIVFVESENRAKLFNHDELNNFFMDDPMSSLQGKIAGVNISNFSGEPGGMINLNIRGINSLFFTQEPLIIMDGVPLLNTTDIVFSDIESIEVVKDIAALAKYGSRGANGLIIIKSRMGKSGNNAVVFNSSFGLGSVPGQIKMLDGNQAFNLMQNLNATFEETEDDKSIYWGSGDFESGEFINTGDLQNINWQDRLFQTGTRQNYSLAFTGGSETSSFRVAGSYLKNEGIIKPSGYTRMNLSFNFERRISDRFRVSTGLNFMNSEKNHVNTSSSAEDGGVILSALATPPFLPVMGNTNEFFINPVNPVINNVDANRRGIEDITRRNAVRGYVVADYQITKDFSFEVSGSSNMSLDNRKMFMSTRDVYIGRELSGMARFRSTEYVIWNAGGYFKYNKEFSEHSFETKAGGEILGSKNSWNSAMATNFTNDFIKLLTNPKEASSNLHTHQVNSVLGTFSYDFSNKYLFDLNLRADAVSRFSDIVEVNSDPIKPEVWEIERDYKWGSSYGASLGWNLAREDFMAGMSSINDIILKVSYGIAGNDGGYHTGRIYPYLWDPSGYSFNPDEDYTEALFPGIGYRISNLQSAFWEKTSEYNLGMEISAFSDRLFVKANYYNRTSNDLIVPASDTSYSNLGSMLNKGLELSLHSMNISGERFSWGTGLMYTNLSNQVKETDPSGRLFKLGFNGNSNVIAPGYSAFSFYGLETDGIFQNQSEVENHPLQEGAGPGDIRYKNQDGNDVIDENDLVVIGNPNPNMIAGLTNTFRYKNLQLSVFFQGVFGHDILNLTRMQTESADRWINQSEIMLNRWDGQGSSTNIPRANIGSNNSLISDRFIEDGSYIRLKSVTLTYTIPKTGQRGPEFVKVFISGQNLLTFTSYSGYDPEVSIMGPLGIDYGAYPNSRFIGGGISLGL